MEGLAAPSETCPQLRCQLLLPLHDPQGHICSWHCRLGGKCREICAQTSHSLLVRPRVVDFLCPCPRRAGTCGVCVLGSVLCSMGLGETIGNNVHRSPLPPPRKISWDSQFCNPIARSSPLQESGRLLRPFVPCVGWKVGTSALPVPRRLVPRPTAQTAQLPRAAVPMMDVVQGLRRAPLPFPWLVRYSR